MRDRLDWDMDFLKGAILFSGFSLGAEGDFLLLALAFNLEGGGGDCGCEGGEDKDKNDAEEEEGEDCREAPQISQLKNEGGFSYVHAKQDFFPLEDAGRLVGVKDGGIGGATVSLSASSSSWLMWCVFRCFFAEPFLEMIAFLAFLAFFLEAGFVSTDSSSDDSCACSFHSSDSKSLADGFRCRLLM